jgi:hypothetical protein
VDEPQDSLFLLVEPIDDWGGVVVRPGGEYIDVVVVAHDGEELETMRPEVEFELFVLVGEFDLELIAVEDGVHQGLVQVKDQALLLRV